jgi:hypothetical protein
MRSKSFVNQATKGILLLVLVAASTIVQGSFVPANAACFDPAGPGVDWSGCDKSNISAFFVDLSNANPTVLRGVLRAQYGSVQVEGIKIRL